MYTIEQLQALYPELTDVSKRARIARTLLNNYLGDGCCEPVKCCCGENMGVWEDTSQLPLAKAYSYWCIPSDIVLDGITYKKDMYLVQIVDEPLGAFDYTTIEYDGCGQICITAPEYDIAFIMAFESETGEDCCCFRSFSFGSISLTTKDACTNANSDWRALLEPYRCTKAYKI